MPDTDNVLHRKLEQFARMSDADSAAIGELTRSRVRRQRAREDIIVEGARPEFIYIMLEGWACRYKVLEDGRRQILAYFLPGDMCDLNIFILREMDHSIAALTPVTYAQVDRATIERVLLDQPRVTQALLWETLVNVAIQREWTVNLGQRTAFERLGHLLCELFLRLRGVRLTAGNSCPFPLTQTDLANTMGLSAVHVNRTLQSLRSDNLVFLSGRRLTIPDLNALKEASLYNDNYLHMGQEAEQLNANDVSPHPQ